MHAGQLLNCVGFVRDKQLCQACRQSACHHNCNISLFAPASLGACCLQVWTLTEAGKPLDRLPILLPPGSPDAGFMPGPYADCISQVKVNAWHGIRLMFLATQGHHQASLCSLNLYTDPDLVSCLGDIHHFLAAVGFWHRTCVLS